MRLLLDAHHSRLAAQRLRAQGHDVAASSDDPVLASLTDEELLRAATIGRRVLVTENAKDFDRIAREWGRFGEHHPGIVFTSPRRYHRANRRNKTDQRLATGSNFLGTSASTRWKQMSPERPAMARNGTQHPYFIPPRVAKPGHDGCGRLRRKGRSNHPQHVATKERLRR